MGGELLAEYAANAAASSPQKEYGYRNGQLLVTAEPSANIHWLVTDQLGTPRMIADLSGSLSSLSRHDYLPFGEELYAGVGGRTTGQGYTLSDTDPLLSSGNPSDPQTWNRFGYAVNNPLRYIDPSGMYIFESHVKQEQRDAFNTALAQARKNLKAYGEKHGTNGAEYKKASRALDAYGEKDKDNGVMVAARDGVGSARVESGRSKRIVVSFDVAEFKKDSVVLGIEIGHEGSHAADKREWINSGFANSKDPTTYRTEFGAYTVSGFLAQAHHLLSDRPGTSSRMHMHLPSAQLPGMAAYPQENVDLWNSSWAPADISTLRAKGIDKVLERRKNVGGLYGVTPTRQGRKAF